LKFLVSLVAHILNRDTITYFKKILLLFQDIVNIDSAVVEISSLEPGWSAERESIGEERSKYKDNEI